MLKFRIRWCKIAIDIHITVFAQLLDRKLSDGFARSAFTGLSLLLETGTYIYVVAYRLWATARRLGSHSGHG